MTDPKADIVKCGPCAEGVRCRIHSAPDDPRTLTLTAPDGWEYRHRPEGGWPDPWDGTKWRDIGAPSRIPYSHRPPPDTTVILVCTPPPTVTIAEADLGAAFGAVGWAAARPSTEALFAALRRVTGEGE